MSPWFAFFVGFGFGAAVTVFVVGLGQAAAAGDRLMDEDRP